jgi:hypothetical protein
MTRDRSLLEATLAKVLTQVCERSQALLFAKIFSKQQILVHANGATDLALHPIQTSQGQVGFNPIGIDAHCPNQGFFSPIQVLIQYGKQRGTHL